MRNGRAGGYEFVVRLEDPNDLFEARPADVARGRPPEEPAIQQIRDELREHPRGGPTTLTIALPPEKATPEVERGLRRAIARYCEAGSSRAQHDLAAVHRDGRRTLVFGAAVLFVGLVLSEAVLKSKIPKELRDFFGNGLFLVVAWVGLWYPLDLLVYGGQASRSERRLLRAIAALEVRVQAEDQGYARAPEPALGDQSLTGG